MPIQEGTLCRLNGRSQILLNYNDRKFGKRMFIRTDNKSTEARRHYTSSSIDLAFDGGNYFKIGQEMKEDDLKGVLELSDRQGRFQAPKDIEKVQNC